tara:strand:- start:143 stop:349 length:207 start_codon:yes stop_codon:yes gene_type:complete
MKRRSSNVWLLSVAVTLLLSTGCLHPRLDRGEELINHPQFEAAATAAPDWVAEALDIIVELEAEVERK